MSHGPVPAIDRIVLTGFMAAGKTTVGRRLAERIGWDFLDFDEEIEARTGSSSGSIIRERGEAAFRRIEADVTERLAGRRHVVLSPGGGWAANPSLFLRLGPGTVRVWLRISVEEAVRRAEAADADRPLLGEPTGRMDRAKGLLASREPLYARAELTVDVEGKGPDEVAAEIERWLGLNREDDER